MDMMEDLMAESGLDGGGIISNYQNLSHTLDNRYGLCNLSRYAGLPFCANKTSGVDEFRPDYSHGFAMQRIISIVVKESFGIFFTCICLFIHQLILWYFWHSILLIE